MFIPCSVPSPTFVGSGVKVLSSWLFVPAPNWICKLPLEVNLVINLLGTFCSSIVFGTLFASAPALALSTNIVSCPRKGTSYHLLVEPPVSSVISNIPIIFVSSTVIVLNLVA